MHLSLAEPKLNSMQPNLLVSALTALFPLVFGFIWYHPKILAGVWRKAAGVPEDSRKGTNLVLLVALTYIFSFFIAVTLHFITIHQYGLQSLILPEKGQPIDENTVAMGQQVLTAFQHSFRTFHHGVLHGAITGILFITPILGVNTLFERKGWKYLLINAGFWIICLAVMGGIVCRFG